MPLRLNFSLYLSFFLIILRLTRNFPERKFATLISLAELQLILSLARLDTDIRGVPIFLNYCREK